MKYDSYDELLYLYEKEKASKKVGKENNLKKIECAMAKVYNRIWETEEPFTSKVYDWFLKTYQYTVIKTLTSQLLLTLSLENNATYYSDEFMFHNLKQITNLIKEERGEPIDNFPKKHVNFTKFTMEEYENLIAEILISLDPSNKYLKMYEQARSNGRIITMENDDDLRNFKKEIGLNENDERIKKEWQTFEIDGASYIIECKNNTISDIVSMLHEFSHYVTKECRQEKAYQNKLLLEFPSIFFEFYALKYLLENDVIKKEEIAAQYYERMIYDRVSLSDSTNILDYLIKLSDTGSLTEHDIKNIAAKNFQKEMFLAIPEEPRKKYLRKKNFYSEEDAWSKLSEREKNIIIDTSDKNFVAGTEKMIYQDLCSLISNTSNSLCTIKYSIGTYLALNTILLLDDNPREILNEVLYITENLHEVDILEVFNFCQVPKKYEFKYPEKVLTYTKK